MNAIEIILDTVDFYHKNENKRAVSMGDCQYLTEDGRRCAVGRYVLDEHIEAIEAVEGDFGGSDYESVCSLLGVETLDSYMKEEVRGMPRKFWTTMQDLHDRDECWAVGKGLTHLGKNAVVGLLVSFGDMSNGEAWELVDSRYGED